MFATATTPLTTLEQITGYFKGFRFVGSLDLGITQSQFTTMTRELLDLLYQNSDVLPEVKPLVGEEPSALGGFYYANKKAYYKEIRDIKELGILGAYPTAAMLLANQGALTPNSPYLIDLYRVISEGYPLVDQNPLTRELSLDQRMVWKYYLNSFFGRMQNKKGTYQIGGLTEVPVLLHGQWTRFQEKYAKHVLYINTDKCFLHGANEVTLLEDMERFFKAAGFHRLSFQDYAEGLFMDGDRYRLWNEKVGGESYRLPLYKG